MQNNLRSSIVPFRIGMAAYSRAQPQPSIFSHVIKRMRSVDMDRGACTSGGWCSVPASRPLTKSDSSNQRGADDATSKSAATGYAQALKDYLFVPRTNVSGRDVNIAAPISF